MRLLVVSRSPMMAMTLRGESFEVLDLRPTRFPEWLASDSDDVDALVLDLADPRVALQAVIELRARARMAPALLVSSEDEGWDDLAVRDLPAARVLPLPVTRPALLSALSELLAEQNPGPDDPEHPTDQAHGSEQPPPPSEQNGTPEPPPAGQLTRLATAPAFPADVSAVAAVAVTIAPAPILDLAHPRPTPHPTEHLEREGSAVPAAVDSTRPDASPVISPAEDGAGPIEASGTTTQSPEASTPAPQASVPPAPPAPVTERPAAPATPAEVSAAQLVRLLTERVVDLVSVAEVADVIIADAVERVRAQAGALLVPDGARWRVSGGVGLRPLEQRLELDETSWLVTEVAQAGQGVIVEDSDIARNPLKGAPLASWRHILAAPIPLVEAILVLARAEQPFEESDLGRLVALSKEAGPLLRTAMETRTLARSLATFSELEPS